MPYKEGKKWRGVVKINGMRVAQKSGFLTKKEAREWEIDERRRHVAQPTHMACLLEAANEYLNYSQKRFTHKTYLDKKRVLRELVQTVGDIPVNEIKGKVILNEIILSKSTPNLSNRTRKDLHSFFEFCAKFHGLSPNPVTPIDKLPVTRPPQRVPTEKEVIRLLMVANRHDRNLITACITTGGRRSEIFRWTWHEDVNFEEKKVRLGTRKTVDGTMKYRWLPMNEMLYAALQDQWKTRLPQSDSVFQNRDSRSRYYGQGYTTRRKFMKGLCKLAGIPFLGFHALRRFFASLLSDKHKISLRVIQELLGHASLTTTQRYIYNISEDAKSAVDKIDFEIKSTRSSTRQIKNGLGDGA